VGAASGGGSAGYVDLSAGGTERAAAPWRAWTPAGVRVERPESSAALAALAGECARAGTALLPCGGGTALAAGGAPEACGVVVSLGRLSGIVDYAPDDLTVTVDAGASLAELAPVLAERGQWLPGAPAAGTAGGLVAAGFTAAGARGVHGLTRERVLGAQVAGADGVLTRSGGRVVKNVAGYDLHRLHAGAGGAFGVLTEICFRLEPLPERRESVTVVVGDPAAAEAAWRWLRREGPDPGDLELRASPAGGVRLRASFLGDDEPVREAAAAVRRTWGRWGRIGEEDDPGPASAAAAGGALALRLLVAPSRVFAAQARVEGLANSRGLTAAVVTHPNDGELHVRLEGDAAALDALLADVAAGARAGQWHYRIDDQPSGWSASVPAWSADPAALRLLARLKAAFDPGGVLRPGSYSAARLEGAAAYFAGAAPEDRR
jgi:glycolate oxidase FAD binding subunit